MPRNAISYEGRLLNTERSPIEFGKFSEGGTSVLKFTVAEQHQGKNGKVAKQYQDPTKAADAWVNTTTSWHKVTVFGETAEALVQDPLFNNGAIVVIEKASYTEEDAWTTRDGVSRAGRPETIGDDGDVSIKEYNGRVFGAYEEAQIEIWNGVTPIPLLKSKGSGSAPRREYADDEGF
jgi:hypothetical protein